MYKYAVIDKLIDEGICASGTGCFKRIRSIDICVAIFFVIFIGLPLLITGVVCNNVTLTYSGLITGAFWVISFIVIIMKKGEETFMKKMKKGDDVNNGTDGKDNLIGMMYPTAENPSYTDTGDIIEFITIYSNYLFSKCMPLFLPIEGLSMIILISLLISGTFKNKIYLFCLLIPITTFINAFVSCIIMWMTT